MKIQLIKNSQLTYKNKIAHNGDFTIIENYLTANTNYDESKFDTLSDITGKTLTQNKFNSTFINGTDEFDITKINEYDSAVVLDYPYLPSIKTFWIITNKKLDSNKNWTFTLEIDLVTTFGLGKLNLDKDIRISRKHINDLNQFSNYGSKELKQESIIRHQQPSNDFEIITKQKNNIFYNDAETRINEYAGNDNYWYIMTFANSEPIVTYPVVKLSDDTESAEFLQPDIELILPATNKLINTTYYNENGNPVNGVEVIPADTFKNLIDDNRLKLMRIIDFLPDKYLDKENLKLPLDLDFKDYITMKGNGSQYFIGNLLADISGFVRLAIDKDTILTPYKINESLFDYEMPDTFFSDNETNNLWNPNQVLIMDFAPFKKFELAFENENEFSNQVFANNDLSKMPVKDSEFVNKGFGFASIGYTIINEVINKITGTQIQKIDRSMEAGLINDAWENRNQQKAIRIAQDFALPAAGTATGAALGGPIGAAIGFGLTTTNTILKNQKVKQTPDTIINASSDLKNETILGLNSRTINIHTTDDKTKERLAFEFHKFGLYYFEYSDNFTYESLLPKYRFNYLELSQLETIDVIKDLDNIFKILYLSQLQNGIVFWNYYDQDNLKSMLFNYNYKNPDKQGILETMNRKTFKLDQPVEGTYIYKIDNSTGKYDSGITLTLFRTQTGSLGSSGIDAIITVQLNATNNENLYWEDLAAPLAFREIKINYSLTTKEWTIELRDSISIVGFDFGIAFVSSINTDDLTFNEFIPSAKGMKKLAKLEKRKKVDKKVDKGMTKKELTPEQKESLARKTAIKGNR